MRVMLSVIFSVPMMKMIPLAKAQRRIKYMLLIVITSLTDLFITTIKGTHLYNKTVKP